MSLPAALKRIFFNNQSYDFIAAPNASATTLAINHVLPVVGSLLASADYAGGELVTATITDGIVNEVVYLTGHVIGSNNFTAQRAQEGTSAVDWTARANARIDIRLTAAWLNAVVESLISIDSAVLPLASQAEAEAGTANDKGMTPLRTAQAIAALAGGGGVDPWMPYDLRPVGGSNYNIMPSNEQYNVYELMLESGGMQINIQAPAVGYTRGRVFYIHVVPKAGYSRNYLLPITYNGVARTPKGTAPPTSGGAYAIAVQWLNHQCYLQYI